MAHLPESAVSALLSIRMNEAPLDDVLQRMVEIAKAALDDADEVSTTLVRGGKPFTAAYTGDLALDADEMQYEQGYGPRIDAGVSGTMLHVPDMTQETRWPDYAERVVPRGVMSSLSVPLPIQTEVVGALNCYSRTPNAFGEAQQELASELAPYIAIAVSNAFDYNETIESINGMRIAMETRGVIEQAKGIVMSQSRCTPDAAFDILRRASQARNVKLRDLAQELVDKASNP